MPDADTRRALERARTAILSARTLSAPEADAALVRALVAINEALALTPENPPTTPAETQGFVSQNPRV